MSGDSNVDVKEEAVRGLVIKEGGAALKNIVYPEYSELCDYLYDKVSVS